VDKLIVETEGKLPQELLDEVNWCLKIL
jgi:hypothetical protein